MGQIKKHLPVKLIIGLIFKEETIYPKIEAIFEKKFGNIDFASENLPFNHTAYYAREFGNILWRKFISFQKLFPPENLPRVKVFTNKIENKFLNFGKREINIDPGYLELSKLVLATTKDFNHRIYLTQGIYAEITLNFRDKTFKPYEWTYPDYRTEGYIQIFNQIRNIYAQQL